MAVPRTYERFAHTPVYATAGIDKFAAARLPAGEIPPVLGEVTFFVTGRVTAPAATYDPPRELISWTNRSGFFLFSGEMRKPGESNSLKLTTGRYSLRVESDYYQVVRRNINWPPKVYDSAQDLPLLPGPDYPFPDLDLPQRQLKVTLLRGSLLTAGGEPITGVKVEFVAPVLPVPPPPPAGQAPEPPYFIPFIECDTNKRGDWVLALIEANAAHNPVHFEHSRIRVNLASGAYEADVAIIPGTENSLRQTALRGRVVKPGGTPLPGTKITTSIAPGESIARADGQWFFYFELRQGGGSVTVTATAPNGDTATRVAQIVPGETRDVPEMEIS